MKQLNMSAIALAVSLCGFAANADGVTLGVGQSLVFCISANTGYPSGNAVANLNRYLLKSDGTNKAVSVNVPFSDGTVLMTVSPPYTVSAPTVSSYDREGTQDVACVTITKN